MQLTGLVKRWLGLQAVFEGGKAIESFEMIDLRNEIVEEIQNKNVKIKEERD